MPSPTQQSPGRSRGRERAEGGRTRRTPTSPQRIGIQAEICGIKVKLGGQPQSFLISSG